MHSDAANPTPLVKLNRVIPNTFKYTEFYAKLEWYNPFGSVKDRGEIFFIFLTNFNLFSY